MKVKGQEVEKLAFTINEFIAATGIGRTSIYELINEGKLRAVRVAGRTLIPRDAALRLLADAERVK